MNKTSATFRAAASVLALLLAGCGNQKPAASAPATPTDSSAANVGPRALAAKDLQNRQDITNLHQAVASFKLHFGVDYLPSRITLASKAAAMDKDSLNYVCRLFPNGQFLDRVTQKGIVWNDQAEGAVTLEGNECLVFFLGGPQRGGKPTGWSVNPTDPADPTGERTIFYAFPKDRLKPLPGRKFLSYFDPYDQQPYAYFSITGIAPNNYNPADCAALGVAPYGSRGNFNNPNSYQIITAGRNGKWGKQGGQWTAERAPQVYPPGSDGADDLGNFRTTELGSIK